MKEENERILIGGSPIGSTAPSDRRHLLQTLGALGATSLVTTSSALGGEPNGAPPATDALVGTTWWAELVASDLSKAADFYASVVGWTVKTVAMADSTRAPKDGEPAYLLFVSAGNEVAGGLLASSDTPGKSKPTWVIYFQVPDVDIAVAKAIAKGGTLLIHPFVVVGSARLAVVSDLDGTPFGLASPL